MHFYLFKLIIQKTRPWCNCALGPRPFARAFLRPCVRSIAVITRFDWIIGLVTLRHDVGKKNTHHLVDVNTYIC
jgi:hypothetical protein